MGNCGVCLVEVAGEKDLVKACSYKVKDGDIINTVNERVQTAVKHRVSEILNDHSGKCKRLKNCQLLKLAIKVNAKKTKNFINDNEKYIDDRSKSIVIDRSKCIKCERCVAACREKIGTEIMNFRTDSDNNLCVGPENLACFDETKCLLCGQCVAACPVNHILIELLMH